MDLQHYNNVYSKDRPKGTLGNPQIPLKTPAWPLAICRLPFAGERRWSLDHSKDKGSLQELWRIYVNCY